MTKQTENTFSQTVKSFSDKRVATMQKAIEKSFARRDKFEGETAKVSSSSYAVNRDKVLANSAAVARFFLALNIEAENVIERKVSSTKMFNAKALKKIVELARFANGAISHRDIELVMRCFILCAVRFNGDAISNTMNKHFLSGADLSKIVNDEKLADYIAQNQHKFMSGGKDTQSSQARNVLDVLSLGQIVNDDNRYRGAIKLNSDHAFIQELVQACTK